MWPAIIAGGAALLGGIMTNRSNARTAAAQMQFSDEQSQANRDFQADMANTAHQREVNDLAAAGLNPILSGTGGMGSVSPSGAMGASAGYASVDSIGNATASAMAARRNVEEVKNIAEDTKLKTQQEDLAREQKHKTYQESRIAEELFKQAEQNTSIVTATAKGAKTEGEIDESKYGAFMRYLNRLNPFGSMGSGAIRNLSK